MKKRSVIISVSFIIIIFLSFILIQFNMKIKQNKNITKSTPENTQKQLKNLLDKELINKNLTMAQVKKILGRNTNSQNLILGNDSYIMEMPSKLLIKKYNLEDDIKKQKEYAKRIQQEFLNEFKYEFTNVKEFEDQIHQTIEITTLYYGAYLLDLNELISWLTDENNIDISGTITTQNEVKLYKYKVLCMEVLDNNLDFYKNTTGEKVKVDIIYRNGKPANSNEIFSLLCNMIGLTYKNAWNDSLNSESRQVRLNNYKEQLKKYIS